MAQSHKVLWSAPLPARRRVEPRDPSGPELADRCVLHDPPGQLGGLEEGGRVAAAGIGDERLAVARDDRVEQAEQRGRVALLVEDVGRQDELEGPE